MMVSRVMIPVAETVETGELNMDQTASIGDSDPTAAMSHSPVNEARGPSWVPSKGYGRVPYLPAPRYDGE
jgi:hypothetical protein